MESIWVRLLWAVLPSLLCGVLMAHFNRRQAKRERETDRRAQTRKEESLLSLDMQMANGKLAYAMAMAIKRGAANGEVEEGIEAYKEAKRKYVAFLNRQANEHISEE